MKEVNSHQRDRDDAAASVKRKNNAAIAGVKMKVSGAAADAATTAMIGARIGDLRLSAIPVNTTPASDRWASGLGGSVVNHSQRGWRWYSVKRVLAVLATSDNPLVNHRAAQAHR